MVVKELLERGRVGRCLRLADKFELGSRFLTGNQIGPVQLCGYDREFGMREIFYRDRVVRLLNRDVAISPIRSGLD